MRRRRGETAISGGAALRSSLISLSSACWTVRHKKKNESQRLFISQFSSNSNQSSSCEVKVHPGSKSSAQNPANTQRRLSANLKDETLMSSCQPRDCCHMTSGPLFCVMGSTYINLPPPPPHPPTPTGPLFVPVASLGLQRGKRLAGRPPCPF